MRSSDVALGRAAIRCSNQPMRSVVRPVEGRQVRLEIDHRRLVEHVAAGESKTRALPLDEPHHGDTNPVRARRRACREHAVACGIQQRHHLKPFLCHLMEVREQHEEFKALDVCKGRRVTLKDLDLARLVGRCSALYRDTFNLLEAAVNHAPIGWHTMAVVMAQERAVA